MKNVILRALALILIVCIALFAVACTPKSDNEDKGNSDSSSDNGGSTDGGTDGSTDSTDDFDGNGFIGEWDTEF